MVGWIKLWVKIIDVIMVFFWCFGWLNCFYKEEEEEEDGWGYCMLKVVVFFLWKEESNL